MSHPWAAASRRACGSSYTGPTSFDGLAKAGSAALTRVWLTRQATSRPGTALRSACASQ